MCWGTWAILKFLYVDYYPTKITITVCVYYIHLCYNPQINNSSRMYLLRIQAITCKFYTFIPKNVHDYCDF